MIKYSLNINKKQVEDIRTQERLDRLKRWYKALSLHQEEEYVPEIMRNMERVITKLTRLWK